MTEKTSFSDLISKISGRVDKSQDFTQDFIRELVSIIEAGLKSNGSVSISGFGKFELRWMDERKGINPQTGEELTIPGQNKVVFKPFKSLRDHVNRPYARMEPQVLEESAGKKEESSAPPAPPAVKIFDENVEEENDDAEEKEDIKDEESLEAVDTGRPDATPPEPKEDYEAAPFPFFIEEEDEETETEETLEDLLIIRESPVPKDELAVDFDESEMAREVQKQGTSRWPYIAAAILAFIIILGVYYLFSGQHEPEMIPQEPPLTETLPDPDPVPETAPAPDPEPESEPEPDPVIEETEPADIEETEFIAIIIAAGQNLWNLAIEYLGDPYLWPWIYYLNLETIEEPNLVYSGTDLTIPVPTDIDNLTNTEMREIAYGYVHAYLWFRENQPEDARNYLWAAGVYDLSVLDEFEGVADPDDLRFARNR